MSNGFWCRFLDLVAPTAVSPLRAGTEDDAMDGPVPAYRDTHGWLWPTMREARQSNERHADAEKRDRLVRLFEEQGLRDCEEGDPWDAFDWLVQNREIVRPILYPERD